MEICHSSISMSILHLSSNQICQVVAKVMLDYSFTVYVVECYCILTMCVHVPIKESMNSFDLNLELRSSNEIEGVSCICCPPTGVPGAPPIVSTWKQLNYLDMLQRHEKLHVIYLTKHS